jgi:hypothetical protein
MVQVLFLYSVGLMTLWLIWRFVGWIYPSNGTTYMGTLLPFLLIRLLDLSLSRWGFYYQILTSGSLNPLLSAVVATSCPLSNYIKLPFLLTVEEFSTTLSGMLFIFVKDGVVTYSNLFFTHSRTVFNFFELGVSALSYLPCFDKFLYRSTTNIFARCEDDDESMMMMSVL